MYVGLQRAPCGLPLDTATTHTTKEQHAANLQFIAQLTDTLIKSWLFGDTASTQFLTHKLVHDPLVALVESS